MNVSTSWACNTYDNCKGTAFAPFIGLNTKSFFEMQGQFYSPLDGQLYLTYQFVDDHKANQSPDDSSTAVQDAPGWAGPIEYCCNFFVDTYNVSAGNTSCSSATCSVGTGPGETCPAGTSGQTQHYVEADLVKPIVDPSSYVAWHTLVGTWCAAITIALLARLRAAYFAE